MKHLPFPPTLATLALAALSLSGCTRQVVDLDGSDHDVVFPTLRGNFDLLGRHPRGSLVRGDRDGEERDAVELRIALDIEAAPSEARFSESLAAFEEIDLGGESLFGPADARVDMDVFDSHLGASFGGVFLDMITVDAILGLWVQNTQITVKSATGRLSRNDWNVGPYSGFQIGIWPLDWLGVYGRTTSAIEPGEHEVTHSTAEAGIELIPLPGLAVFGGWKHVDFDEDRSESDIEVELSGPVVGLQLTF